MAQRLIAGQVVTVERFDNVPFLVTKAHMVTAKDPHQDPQAPVLSGWLVSLREFSGVYNGFAFIGKSEHTVFQFFSDGTIRRDMLGAFQTQVQAGTFVSDHGKWKHISTPGRA